MSVLIAGHSKVKYLNQHISDPHVSCISKPGGKISKILPLIHEAVEYFNVTTPPPHNPLYKGGGSNKSLRNNPFCKLMYFGETYMQK